MNEIEKINEWLNKLPVRVPDGIRLVSVFPEELWPLYEMYAYYKYGKWNNYVYLLRNKDINKINHSKHFASTKQYMVANFNNIDNIIPKLKQAIEEYDISTKDVFGVL